MVKGIEPLFDECPLDGGDLLPLEGAGGLGDSVAVPLRRVDGLPVEKPEVHVP